MAVPTAIQSLVERVDRRERLKRRATRHLDRATRRAVLRGAEGRVNDSGRIHLALLITWALIVATGGSVLFAMPEHDTLVLLVWLVVLPAPMLWLTPPAWRRALMAELIARGLRPADCLACGYDLRGIHSPRCPECGMDLVGWRDEAAERGAGTVNDE